MTEKEAAIAFNMIPDIGYVRLCALARDYGGSFAKTYDALPAARKIGFDGKEPDWKGELQQAKKYGVSVITKFDPEWPEKLSRLSSPPLALYVSGNVKALSGRFVAIVGTRRATMYGRDVSEKLSFNLCKAGLGVMSGLALGIDAAAHSGALEAHGVTVGILGGALDRFYPEQNRALARKIVESGGAVASEFPFGKRPDSQTFPQRNRIVAALSDGVVAVESPLQSGTLITTSIAADIGVPVMAVPGNITSKLSQGCLRLIRNGARMVTSADDILEEINPIFKQKAIAASGSAVSARPGTPKTKPDVPPFSLEESLVLKHLGDEPKDIDSLVRAAKIPVSRINSILVGLRMKRKVRFLPGNRVQTTD